MTSYYAQQKVLLDEVKPKSKSKFNRDGGFMDFVTKLIAKKFGIKKGAVKRFILTSVCENE